MSHKINPHKINPYGDAHHHHHHREQKHNTLPDYNTSRPLSNPKYKVKYYLNNSDIVGVESFVIDPNVYELGDIATILGYNSDHFSEDGAHVYIFSGWSRRKDVVQDKVYAAGTEYVMEGNDLRLYANWQKVSTINVSSSGELSLKPDYRMGITNLRIPEYYLGTRIKTIAERAFDGSNINTIHIPANVVLISKYAFSGWQGTNLRFIDADITVKYPGLNIKEFAFAETPNLTHIVLPYRWKPDSNNTGVLFPSQPKEALHIYIRNTKPYISELMNVDEYAIEDKIAGPNGGNYTRVIFWGYND